MPKLSKIQSNFNAGEISQNVYGRVDSERYDTALSYCYNYFPLLQGPLTRRSGTKYVANVKDSTKPPDLIPFNYNGTQSYILEFGDKYIRFFANDGQVITTSTQFNVVGLYDRYGLQRQEWDFTAVRPDYYPRANELIVTSNVLPAGSILELVSPYSYQDVQQLRYAQSQDTLFITHPAYPPFKLQRTGATYFDLKPLILQDGPYLPLNSYRSLGDSIGTALKPNARSGLIDVKTQANLIIAAANSGGAVGITTAGPHGFSNGDLVFVSGVAGTTEANNNSSSVSTYAWRARVSGPSSLDLLGTTFVNPMVGSTGFVYPALFQQTADGWIDQFKPYGPSSGGVTGGGGRTIALYNGGTRFWGTIVNIVNANEAIVSMGVNQVLLDSTVVTTWQLGSYYQSNFPSVCCFHQNRLLFAGQPAAAQELDGSYIADYENFAASGSNLQVSDANAFQFNLLSNEVSPIYWMKSVAQGLLVGTYSTEWQIQPNTQSPGLTPTNFSAQKISSFGSANFDAAQLSNSVIYMQSAQRRLRELNYFVQVGTFRSTNLSELSEHITLPSLIELAVQKEPHPLVWGLRSDGNLITLTYSRDDVSLKAGFSHHTLGGQSDATGTPPSIADITIASASSLLYNELWMTVSRTNSVGSSYVSVEYMTKTFPENGLQEDAYYVDCGATYDQPVAVSAISNAASCVVTAPNHGFTASTSVRFYTAVGLNSSTTDVNGIVTQTNLINYNTFLVASTSTNAFKLQDSLGNDVSSIGYSAYLGSSVVRKLVSTITGLTWLKGDTVNVLADGGIHPPVVVNSAGAIALAYPAAKVHVGYGYTSDATLLKTKEGSAQGTSIGSTRRVNRVAFMLHNVAELSYGTNFTNMFPVEFPRAGVNAVDTASPLNNGVYREGFQGTYTYDDAVCIRQSAPLPGTIQAVVRFLEENDV